MARKRKTSWPKNWSYFKFAKSTLYGEEWKKLTPTARDVYQLIKGKYIPSNGNGSGTNGKIRMPYSEIRKYKGLRRFDTVSNAIKELESKGWIKRTVAGGMYGRPNLYELTGEHDPTMRWDESQRGDK